MTAQAPHTAFARIRDFAADVARVESLSSLRGLLGEVVPGFGIDYFLMAHHVDFGRRPVPSSSVIIRRISSRSSGSEADGGTIRSCLRASGRPPGSSGRTWASSSS